MALAVHMDGCAARYARSVEYRRKLESERPTSKSKTKRRRAA